MRSNKIKTGIVDDHRLFSRSLALMLENLNDFEVTIQAENGKDLQDKLNENNAPEIMLVDVNMPVMDGMATAEFLVEQFPHCKLVALTTNDSDKSIIEMIKAGCCAYLLKDIEPLELRRALWEVHEKGYYNADASNINYRRLLKFEQELLNITEKEKQFLQLASSDKTYKQIAAEMGVSERTVDGYRETLFKKLNVQSRVGMVLEGIRKELVKL